MVAKIHTKTLSNCGAIHCSYVMSCCKDSLMHWKEINILRVDKMSLLFRNFEKIAE